jgi:hypothetical protein
MIARWKGIIEEIHFGGSMIPLSIIENINIENPSFRPSKWPQKLKPAKNSKLQNCQKTILSESKKVGGHRYPPISALTKVQVPKTSNTTMEVRIIL